MRPLRIFPCLRTLAAVAALFACALAGSGRVAAGEIVQRDFPSALLHRDWGFALYLPDGYASSGLRYPVLYLLHGHGGNRGAWPGMHIRETMDALIARGAIPPALVVMPDGGTSWYVDREEKMETAILEELVPYVERTLRAIPRRDGRLIGGFSMGGYGALRFVLLRPERFAAAALFSPAIYDPLPPANSSARKVAVFGMPFDDAAWKSLNYPALWDAFLARGIPVPMFIVSGDRDVFYIEGEAARLHERLRRSGQPSELRIVPGGHDGAVWEGSAPEAIEYVFRFAARPSPLAPLP